MRIVPIGCTAVSGTECGRTKEKSSASSSGHRADAARGDGGDRDLARAGGEEQARAGGEASRELRAVGVGHRVADDGAPVVAGEDLAARLVVDHRGEDGEVRVRAHRGHVGGAEAGHRRGGADGMREGGDDPDAPVAPLLEATGARCTRSSAGCRASPRWRGRSAPRRRRPGGCAGRGRAARTGRAAPLRRARAALPTALAARTTTRARTSTRRVHRAVRGVRHAVTPVTRCPSCTMRVASTSE